MNPKKTLPPVHNPVQDNGDGGDSVLVIGAAGIDLVGRLEGTLHPGTSSPAQIRTSLGGVSRNVAENLARLGQSVTLLTAVGDDDQGRRLLDQAAGTGIDVSSVLILPDHLTCSYLAVLNSRGDLEFALDDMHALAALSPHYIRQNAALFKEAAMIFIDANLPSKTLRTVMSLAKKAGVRVCADTTSSALAIKLQKFLPDLYMVTPNHNEAGILCDCGINPASRRASLGAAKRLVSLGVDIAVITLGEYGVCYATSETSGAIPAIVTDVVDPTGVGDALTATIMFALLNDIPLDDALRLGVTAASLTLGYRGAVVPDLSLEKLYDNLVI